MKNWYKLLKQVIWYYYRYKLALFFNLKVYIIYKLFSMALDIYCGHFPKIFQSMTLKLILKNLYQFFSLEFFSYWKSSLILLLIIIFIFLWYNFFFRINLLDWQDEEKIKALQKAQRLKDLQDNLKKKIIKPKDYYNSRKSFNENLLLLLKKNNNKKKKK